MEALWGSARLGEAGLGCAAEAKARIRGAVL